MAYRDHCEQNALNWAAFTRGPEPDAYPDPAEARWLRIPNFLFLRARKMAR